MTVAMLQSFVFVQSVSASTLYGSLYEVAELESAPGEVTPGDNRSGNYESVVMAVKDYSGSTTLKRFLAVTHNDVGGVDLFYSDEYALNWEEIDLVIKENNEEIQDEVRCTNVGRHSLQLFNEDVYFSFHCTPYPLIIRVQDGTTDTGGEPWFEVVYNDDTTSGGLGVGAAPTAANIGQYLYFFMNQDVIRSSDGENWEEVTPVNYPTGSPLEASRSLIDVEGEKYIILPFGNGEVYKFYGTDASLPSMTLIGSGFLNDSHAKNLPSTGVFQGEAYVGSQNSDDGARLSKWDGEGTTTWTDVVDYSSVDPNNTIINKMVNTQNFNNDRYLIFFTANQTDGTEVSAVDKTGSLVQLVDNGLGGTDSDNNNEVVSAIKQTTMGTTDDQPIVIFATQALDTTVSETKIFLLQLSTMYATNPALDYFNEDVDFGSSATITGFGVAAKTKNKNRVALLSEGEVLTVTVPKKKVRDGYRYFLQVKQLEEDTSTTSSSWTTVDSATGEKNSPVQLEYTGAQNKSAGDKFHIRILTQTAYGPEGDRVLATKKHAGNARLVKVVE